MCMLSSSVGQLSTCIAVLYGLVMFQVQLAGKQKQDVVHVCGLAKSNFTRPFYWVYRKSHQVPKLVDSTLSIDRMGSRNPFFGHRALGLKFGSSGF